MDLTYDLSGTFVEACNCSVICPCWVDDEPSEDFCAGLFAWTFAAGSQIEGHDVAGRSLVSVTVHGDARRGGESQSALFVDDALAPAVGDLLVQAFAGRAGGPLAALAAVTGEVILDGRAAVAVTRSGGSFEVSVRAGAGVPVVQVTGHEQRFDSSTSPMTLRHTALHAELGIGAEPVTAQVSDVLRIDVAALPGPSIDMVTRSSMSGSFRYLATGSDDDDD